jgi:DNA-binding NarL/FixJ family response regulator
MESAVAELAPPRAAGLIIVVPDLLLRDRLATYFLDKGFRVWAVPRGSEADAICARHAGEVDAVLADIRLPDASPAELLDWLAGHAPTPPCCFLADRLLSSPALAARLRGAGVVPRTAHPAVIAEMVRDATAGATPRDDD